MRWLTNLVAQISRRLDDDVDAELRSSLEMMADRFAARGMSREEALRAARLEFEGVEQVKEKVRDGLAGAWLRTCAQDVRYAWRGLWRRRSFALIALTTLALGIGVNTAIFSAFYAVLLRPLPYDHPEQLVHIWATLRTAGNSRAPVSGTIYEELQNRNQCFSGVAGIWTTNGVFPGDNPEQVRIGRVTPNLFPLLGVRAEYGRIFNESDLGGPGLILADGVFRRRFGGDVKLIGKSPIPGRPDVLAGVLPPDFHLRFANDIRVPADIQAFQLFEHPFQTTPTTYYIRLMARMKPGVSMAQAQRDLDRVAADLRGAYGDFGRENLRFTAAGMQADAVRDVQPALRALFAGSGFILLIYCVNVSSLLIARAADRRKEIALRLAIGASRGRILRQLMIEGAVLCGLGGAAGVGVGWAGFRGILAIRPDSFSSLSGNALNWPVLGFTALVCLAAATLFGLVPFLESFRLDLIAGLRAGGRGFLGRLHRRAGNTLVVAEVTLAFVLVTCAALTARTLAKIAEVQPGFDSQGLLAFQVAGMPVRAMNDWLTKLRGLPGVASAGATVSLPLDKDSPNWYGPYTPEGFTKEQAGPLVGDYRCITPGYFAAMGARFLEGRDFADTDTGESPQVLIVDEVVARTVWPGQSPIGRKIEVEHSAQFGFEARWSTIVGVVGHIRNHSLKRQLRGELYMPYSQSPRAPMTFVLRAGVPPLTLAPGIRSMLHEGYKTAAVSKVRLMTEYISRELSPAGFTAVLAAIFGALALLLAATGIYGVLDYQVSRRMPEMGIRMALGASAADMLRLVVRDAGLLAAGGVALGAAVALFATRWLDALIYGVSPRDPSSYGLALLLLPAAALAGCWRPAWRAAAADPAASVRQE